MINIATIVVKDSLFTGLEIGIIVIVVDKNKMR